MNVSTNSQKFSTSNILLGIFLIGLLAAIFWPALSSIAEICWTDDDYSHGIILPLICLYMWWDRRDDFLRNVRSSSETNTTKENLFYYLLFFAGMIILSLSVASKLSFFSWVSFFPVVAGIVGLTLGSKYFSSFIGPFALLYMAKPLPDSVVVRLFWPLQVLAAKIGALTLQLLNVPVYLSGNVIEIPGMQLMVEEACSGMRSVMALLTLALIMIYFTSLNLFGKVILLFLSLLMAIALNVFRVSLTGVLAHFYDPEAATGFFHEFSGLLVFIVGLPFLFAAASFLSKRRLTKKV